MSYNPRSKGRSKSERKKKDKSKKARGASGLPLIMPSEMLHKKDRKTTQEALDDPDPMSIFDVSPRDEALALTDEEGDEPTQVPSIMEAWDDVYAERGPEERAKVFARHGYAEVDTYYRSNGTPVQSHLRGIPRRGKRRRKR